MRHYDASSKIDASPDREEYPGLLLGMMWRSMPDLGPSFRTFVDGLKARAESGA